MKLPAILGGEPAFRESLHVGRPNLPDRKTFLAYVDKIFESRRLTNKGPLVREFQDRLQEFLQVKHCIPVCNGTIALELAERALGFKSRVIMPSYTFIATAHSLKWQEITPVFADIENDDVTISPQAVKSLLLREKEISGIMGVHVYGHPCDHIALRDLADEHGIKLLYDAAHSFGCEVDGESIASLGDASVFSFHATKFFNSFEGGAIATDDDELAEKVTLMSNFGFGGVKDKVDYLGINGKMTEISAAMGLAMLDCVEQIRAKNKSNFEVYKDALASIPGVTLMEPSPRLTKSNWQYVIIRLNSDLFGIERDLLVNALVNENVIVRRYFFPGCHMMYPYNESPVNQRGSLPLTEKLAEEVVAFPTGQDVSEEDILKIGTLLETFHELRGKITCVQ